LLQLTADSYVTIFLSRIVVSLPLSLKSSFIALSERFLRPLGAKSGVGVTPELRRTRALCTTRCMALRAALLLRARAQTTFLLFFGKAAEKAPIRRH